MEAGGVDGMTDIEAPTSLRGFADEEEAGPMSDIVETGEDAGQSDIGPEAGGSGSDLRGKQRLNSCLVRQGELYNCWSSCFRSRVLGPRS